MIFIKKTKASLIHLIISAIVIGGLISLLLIFWFPDPFMGMTNFKDIAIILIAIDLVLGPVLTFIVFSPSKKGLRFDLSIIAAVQLIGLSYGLYMLYLSHPVYITYNQNSFNIITAEQARPDKAIDSKFKISKLSSPTFSFLNIPDEETENELFNDMINDGVEIEARADYYEPHTDHLGKILANSIDASKIFSETNIDKASKSFLDKYSKLDNLAFVPITNGGSHKGIIVLDKNSGEPVSLIKTDPWRFAIKQ